MCSKGRTLMHAVGQTGLFEQFVDNSYAWGPVASVDLVLGGKTALNVPIQLIADPAAASPASACSVGGTQISTQTSLGAKGIIGLGMFLQDCGSNCVTNTRNGYYYTCTSAACSSAVRSLTRCSSTWLATSP